MIFDHLENSFELEFKYTFSDKDYLFAEFDFRNFFSKNSIKWSINLKFVIKLKRFRHVILSLSIQFLTELYLPMRILMFVNLINYFQLITDSTSQSQHIFKCKNILDVFKTLSYFMVGIQLFRVKFSLHFRFNGKKFIYGISEELLHCRQQNGILKKFNGTYQPSQRQRKEKSALLLKKQKTLLKVDFIIIPQKACHYQYLWHFNNLQKKLNCRNIIILPIQKQERMFRDASKDLTIKRKIANLLASGHSKDQDYRVELSFQSQIFSKNKYQNIIEKSTLNKAQVSSLKAQNSKIIESTVQSGHFYEQTLNQIVLQMCKDQMKVYAQNSIFSGLKPFALIDKIYNFLDTIRGNNAKNPLLKLTQQQINQYKDQLATQIMRISSSSEVIYPTQGQQIQIVLLPGTSMLTLLHKHQIMLINPTNLSSWKLHYLKLPVQHIKYILITRFSMAFMQLLIAWSSLGKQCKIHSFLTIVTLDHLYQKTKLTLKQVFLWDDEMIRSKISFRVIKSQLTKNQNSRAQQENQVFFPAGFVKVAYSQQVKQDSWTIKFGNKQFLYLNQLLIEQKSWRNRFEYIIFDQIKEEIKKDLYLRSKKQEQIKQRFVYNRSSSAKYRNKYLKFIQENNPILRIQSQIKIQQTILPFYSSLSDTQRYSKIKLAPGQTINCLDRNIILIQGLSVGIYNEFNQITENNQSKTISEIKVHLCRPPNFTRNGFLQNLKFNKIKNIKEFIALKQTLILVQQKQSQIFYQNLLMKRQNQGLGTKSQTSQTYLTQILSQGNIIRREQKHVPFKNAETISPSQLQIFQIFSNSLIRLLSSNVNSFSQSHLSLEAHEKRMDGVKSQLGLQISSPLHQFQNLFRKATFQSGQIINEDDSKVYFVVKGSMRWKTTNPNQQKANNQAFIGNIQRFYSQRIANQSRNRPSSPAQDQHPPIQVIKDSWTLEANIQELHQHFFYRYPEVAYHIISKGRIFN